MLSLPSRRFFAALKKQYEKNDHYKIENFPSTQS
jgi:hypothetical protein